METYYCDGSQHKKLNKMGIGITKGNTKVYYDIQEFEWERCSYEIIAVTKAIEYAIQSKTKSIVVVNDDRHLVEMIKQARLNMRMRTKGSKRLEFKRLVNLVKKHEVEVRTPQSRYDKKQIRKCHDLSRSYMNSVQSV